MQEVAGLKEEDLRPSVSVHPQLLVMTPPVSSVSHSPHTCTQVVTVVLLYTGIDDLHEVLMAS